MVALTDCYQQVALRMPPDYFEKLDVRSESESDRTH